MTLKFTVERTFIYMKYFELLKLNMININF